MASTQDMSGNRDSRIVIGIKLLRLRDRMKGRKDAAISYDKIADKWGDVASAMMHAVPNSGLTPEQNEHVLRSLRSTIELVHVEWEEEFPKEAEAARKLIQLMRALQLDVETERRQLHELEEKSEAAVQKGNAWQSKYAQSVSIRTALKESGPVIQEFVALGREWSSFKELMDRRALDALALVSQTVVSVRSDELYKLFTEEP